MFKHVFAIHKLLEMDWWKKKRNKIRIKRHSPRCRKQGCQSEKIVRNGRRKCKRKGYVQRYLCKSCGHTFSGIDGFTGSHFKPKVIVRALSMMMAVKMFYYEVVGGQLKMLFVIILRLLGGRIIILILCVNIHLHYALMQDISGT